MTFYTFSQYLQKIEATTKRLEITQVLADLYKQLDTSEIQPVSYLLQGKLVPTYEPLEFQLSIKMMMRILSRLSDQPESAVSEKYKKLGDLGTVAEELLEGKIGERDNGKNGLKISAVFSNLTEIAQAQGKGSQEIKVSKTVELLKMLDPLSTKYVVRIILGRLRLGFSDMTMIDALSWTLQGDKSLSKQIEEAYQKQVDIGVIASKVLAEGVESLESIKIKVGTPIIPALCQRLNTTEEIIEKMGQVLAEPKYDGTRVQIHVWKIGKLENGKNDYVIRTYTRNLEESSAMFPELSRVSEFLECESCVLDCEAIGFNPVTGELLPFQQTIQRKRKHGVEDAVQEIPLRFFVFDLLELNGISLIDKPLHDRKAELKALFDDNELFIHSPYIETSDPKELSLFHEKQLAEGLEGAVIKKIDAVYQSGRKGYSWVKIKETEGTRGKLSDTVDCVVLGYFYATGARTSFVIGSLLVGVMDNEVIKTISKVGSGITEDLAKELVSLTDDAKVVEKPKVYEVHKQLIPDVWLSPKVVIEVAADEITESPVHTVGVALRFPRIIRIREDKKWQDITTKEELAQISHLK